MAPSFPRNIFVELMQLATSSVEFSFNSNMHRQIDGVAMGSPLGPALANIFVIFNTRQLLPAIKKDVLPFHHHSNVIYQFVCHCDSRYVGRTSQRLEKRIKQHVPRSIANPPASPNRQSLSRACKANRRPQQFHESSIGQHLLDNAQCALHYSNEKFSIFAWGRSSFHLSALEATFIKFLNPLLCKQKEFVYSLKIS